ncbi:MAG: hypothetical protein LN573_05295 [Rickettsia endosymbiont of Oxypoda opaca]|nr:hypothetical protein [Rickettsia endosymbiont of Oxypoda opaca]
MAGINDKEPKETKLRNPTIFENTKAKLGELNYRVQEYLREKIEKPVSEKFKNRADNNQDINKLSILEKVYAKLNGTDHKGYVEEQKRELNQEKLAAELTNKHGKEISGNVIKNPDQIKEIAQELRKNLNQPYKSSIQTPPSSLSHRNRPGMSNTSKGNSGRGI